MSAAQAVAKDKRRKIRKWNLLVMAKFLNAFPIHRAGKVAVRRIPAAPNTIPATE
jgi:hypothetical protein